MGFWKQLFGLEEIVPLSRIKPSRPAPPLPERPKEVKKDISEPVLSLIQTIEDQEWEYISHYGGYGVNYYTHVWNRKILSVSCRESGYCTADWMNDEEKKVVGIALTKAHCERDNYWSNKKNQQDRESFMIFVKEK